MQKGNSPSKGLCSGGMNRTEVHKPGIVGKDSIFEGLRGRVGGTVFRLLNGVTVASRRPRSQRTESDRQKDGRSRFQLATVFARKELMDPARRAFYEAMFANNPKKLRNSYTAAITYYLNHVHVKPGKLVVPTQKVEAVRIDPPKRNQSVKYKRASRMSLPVSMISRPPLKRSVPLDLSLRLLTSLRYRGQCSSGHHHYIETG